MIINDFLSDPGLHLVAGYLNQHTPHYVKTADIPQDCPGRSGFAVPHSRRLPCHTKVACYLSHLYFHVQRDRFTDAQASEAKLSLDKYAEMYGISGDTQKVAEQFRVEEQLGSFAVNKKIASSTEHLDIADLVRYARELQSEEGTKTASAQSLMQWAFTNQFVDFEASVAQLKKSYGQPEMAQKLAQSRKAPKRFLSVDQLKFAATPRRIVGEVPQLLSTLYGSLPSMSKEAFRQKVAGFRTYLSPVITIGGLHRFAETDVETKLADLNKVTGSPVLTQLLPVPVRGWQDIVESSDANKTWPILRDLPTYNPK